MGSTDPGGVPVENTVRALRRLAPGAALREPRTPELRELARALRGCAPAELAVRYPRTVARVVLADQVSDLGRAVTGLFGPSERMAEAARLVRAAHRHGERRAGPLPERMRTEPGLRAAALGWAEATGRRVLAAELRGVPAAVDGEDGRRAAELVVAAVVPEVDRADCGREVLVPDGGDGRTVAGGDAGSGGAGGCAADSAGECEGNCPAAPCCGGRDRSHPSARCGRHPGPAGRPFLGVRSLHLGRHGFRVDVRADPPVDLVLDRHGPTLRALWWNGLGRVADDLGHEYLLLARDPGGTGIVRHWCHPRPAPGARFLRLESAGYRGERLRLAPAAAGTSAEVVVKAELTVRLAV